MLTAVRVIKWRAARRNTVGRAAALVLAALLAPQVARAQDKGTLNPQPLPPLAKPDDPATPAKELFGRKTAPANLQTRTIGFYSKGCLAGAVALPINGATWQVMRLSRNRNWGHPNLVQFLERLSERAHKIGWNGLLVGDMSQPRGGNRELTREEREEMSATMIVAEDRLDVDPQVWTPAHLAVIRAAAKDPQVARIFVNAAIKKALCRDAGSDRHWLNKVQPWWGHDYHFHVRLACPADSPECKPQPARPADEGCGKDLDSWFTEAVLHPKPSPPAKPRPGPKMADLPDACRQVLLAP